MNNRGQKLGWVITGSGHFFEECLDFMSSLGEFDLFVSKAAEEVVRMYKKKNPSFPAKTRVFRDTTASSAPVGLFYKNYYHTLVVAPATSNSIAKFVAGISDNLATNIFAQAGKCRVPSIVLACDTEPDCRRRLFQRRPEQHIREHHLLHLTARNSRRRWYPRSTRRPIH